MNTLVPTAAPGLKNCARCPKPAAPPAAPAAARKTRRASCPHSPPPAAARTPPAASVERHASAPGGSLHPQILVQILQVRGQKPVRGFVAVRFLSRARQQAAYGNSENALTALNWPSIVCSVRIVLLFNEWKSITGTFLSRNGAVTVLPTLLSFIPSTGIRGALPIPNATRANSGIIHHRPSVPQSRVLVGGPRARANFVKMRRHQNDTGGRLASECPNQIWQLRTLRLLVLQFRRLAAPFSPLSMRRSRSFPHHGESQLLCRRLRDCAKRE